MQTFCSFYNLDVCRSCSWLEIPYPEQILRKEFLVREALHFLAPFELEPTTPSKLKAFRNRAKMIVTGTVDQPIIGLEGKAVLDRGRELLSCPIHHPRLNEVFNALPEWITRFQIPPYQISKRTGELKGLIAFYSPLSDQMYLRWILRSQTSVESIRALTGLFQQHFPFVTCITANIQPIPHAILEGTEEIFLTDEKLILHQVGPFEFHLSPQAFVQTNVDVATHLYQTAAEWIATAAPQRMLELFSGTGAFSFFASDSAREIRGVDVNAEAVKVANSTARRLELKHLTFEVADAAGIESVVEQFSPDLILVNPPRRGLAGATQWILKQQPRNFIYSSCSIESLARDLEGFSSHYRVQRVKIFDLFAHTSHFETLVWLQRVDREGLK